MRFNAKLNGNLLQRPAPFEVALAGYAGCMTAAAFHCTRPIIVRGLQPRLQEGRLRFPQEWIEQLGVLFDRDKKAISGSHFKVKAILIDPGHGGRTLGQLAII